MDRRETRRLRQIGRSNHFKTWMHKPHGATVLTWPPVETIEML
jgi:hypothetical protein